MGFNLSAIKTRVCAIFSRTSRKQDTSQEALCQAMINNIADKDIKVLVRSLNNKAGIRVNRYKDSITGVADAIKDFNKSHGNNSSPLANVTADMVLALTPEKKTSNYLKSLNVAKESNKNLFRKEINFKTTLTTHSNPSKLFHF